MDLPLSRSAAKPEDLYAKSTAAAAVFCAILEFSYFRSFWHGRLPSLSIPSVDGYGFALGRDFINVWMGGRAAFSGGPEPWFDFATYNLALKQIAGDPQLADHFWSYPPHLLLFIWPVGLLPYLPAYALWCLCGLAVYLFAAWSGGADRKDMLLLGLAPAVFVNVFFGQNGFLTAALLIGGLVNLDRRPMVSGALFAILTVKPQFVFLLPLFLAMTGRWRVIVSAVAATAALVAVTSLWFGPDIWWEYLRKVGPQQHWLLINGSGTLLLMVSSAFVNARLVHLPLDTAWAVQALSSSCAVAMVTWTFWRKRDPSLSLALLVTATFLFSPWMLNYDMVVLGWVVILLRKRTDNTPIDHYLAITIWILPVAMLLCGVAYIPIAMLALPAFAGRLIWRLARADAPKSLAADVRPAPVAGSRV